MRHYYQILLFFPLLFCSQTMSAEHVLPEMTGLKIYRSNLESFKNSITKDPSKTAELFLSNDLLKKDTEAACRIVNDLPLKLRLEALNSILDACKNNQLAIHHAFRFFSIEKGDSFEVAPPNMILACNYYVPSINKLYKKAKTVFATNDYMSSELDDILSGKFRRNMINIACQDPDSLGQIPFLSPNKGYWASLPSDKQYSYNEQLKIIDDHVRLINDFQQCRMNILENKIDEEKGIIMLNDLINKMKRLIPQFENLRPLPNHEEQALLMKKYMDEISYAFWKRSKQIHQLKLAKPQNELLNQLRAQYAKLAYPDCYLSEWIVSKPLSLKERYGPKMLKFLDDCQKSLNSSQ